jgi:hypothetical protein
MIFVLQFGVMENAERQLDFVFLRNSLCCFFIEEEDKGYDTTPICTTRPGGALVQCMMQYSPASSTAAV